jgi:hypothetical protein
MRDLALAFAAARREEVWRVLGVSLSRGGKMRCGLCGRTFRTERGLRFHAARMHPNEYEKAVRRALVRLTLRFGGIPKSFVETHAPWLVHSYSEAIARDRRDGRDCLLLFYN